MALGPFVALALLVGCDDQANRLDDVTVTILSSTDERFANQFYWSMPEMFAVFVPLTRVNERGEREGWLAQRWEHSADFSRWTIYLRSDARWHDGVPVTAHDIAFTWDLARHPSVSAVAPGTLDIEVVDDTTYVMALNARTNVNPLSSWWVYYPKHLLEQEDPATLNAWAFWSRPVGNGPYRYVRHVPKTMTELEANPEYFLGRPRVDRLVLRFAENNLTEMLSGNVDVMRIVREAALRVADDARFDVVDVMEGSWTEVIVWNTRRPALSDRRVRRALTLAIDRRELHEALNLPGDLPIYDGPITHRQLIARRYPPPLPYAPEEARTWLDEAGWVDRDGDGVRERGGERLAFTLLAAREEAVRIAVYVQSQLRRVGVEVGIETTEVRLRRRLENGDFDAVVNTFITETTGSRGMRAHFGDGSIGDFRHPEAPGLLEAIEATMDPGATDELFARLYAIVQDEIPVTVLFPRTSSVLVSRRMRGLTNPLQDDVFAYVGNLWVE